MITTKKGDKGMTGLIGQTKVEKDDARIEANGVLDEVSSLIGLARKDMPACDWATAYLRYIQMCLSVVMKNIAGADLGVETVVLTDATKKMEEDIKRLDDDESFNFTFSGDGDRISALLHVIRSKVRTAERRFWSANKVAPLSIEAGVFLNRLSDWLYAIAERNIPDASLHTKK